MLAMASETDRDVVVPPSLQALLAARVDQLELDERSVLERGAVEGETFHRGAVQALASPGTQVAPRLAALVRKALIRPNKPQLVGEDGFRFRHLLIRDAAYEALSKAVRADLHQRFASWLAEHGIELVELDEILGYHLEQAHRYRTELGLPDDPALVATARARLTAAGRRAHLRQDYAAAISLLQRAAALMPPAEVALDLEMDLVDALFWTGRGVEALRRADALAQRASLAGDRVGELCGLIKGGVLRINLEPEGATEKLAALLDEALPEFEAAGNDLALYIGYSGLAWVASMRGQVDAGVVAYERAAAHAEQAGQMDELLGPRASSRVWGTTPVSEVLAWLDENERRGALDYWLRASRALALAMAGRFDEARAILAETRAHLAERGGGIFLAMATGMDSAQVELWAGDFAAAVDFGEEGCRLFDSLEEKSILSTAAAMLAQALYALDRLEEADAWAGRAATLGASDDALTQMLWRQVRAKVLARRGDVAEADRLAREAVAIGEQTEFLTGQADTHADLAEVRSVAGRSQEAAAALERALERYEQKGNIASARRTQSRLADLRGAAPH
jgi:tetratricopeptide (TPR) repeat protein